MRRARLDAELVRRGLARSREHAAELIAASRVSVSGTTASKAATAITTDTPVLVAQDGADENWASRGAHKLIGALAAFPDVLVEGRRVLDAGASTGGFTDVLLRRGAAEVVAVDVGYGQLIWRLQNDDRVRVHDRTNIRNVTPDVIGGVVDLTVSDLSFISLRLVMPALVGCTKDTGDLVLMVKPQFEVGRERIGSGGVVRSSEHRVSAVLGVIAAAHELRWGLVGVAASPLPGPSGNVEYFVHLRSLGTLDAGVSGSPGQDADTVLAAVERAVAEGPQ